MILIYKVTEILVILGEGYICLVDGAQVSKIQLNMVYDCFFYDHYLSFFYRGVFLFSKGKNPHEGRTLQVARLCIILKGE